MRPTCPGVALLAEEATQPNPDEWGAFSIALSATSSRRSDAAKPGQFLAEEATHAKQMELCLLAEEATQPNPDLITDGTTKPPRENPSSRRSDAAKPGRSLASWSDTGPSSRRSDAAKPGPGDSVVRRAFQSSSRRSDAAKPGLGHRRKRPGSSSRRSDAAKPGHHMRPISSSRRSDAAKPGRNFSASGSGF